MPSPLDPASTVFFRLSIDGLDLGLFNSCEGLASEVQVEQREEGATTGSCGSCRHG